MFQWVLWVKEQVLVHVFRFPVCLNDKIYILHIVHIKAPLLWMWCRCLPNRYVQWRKLTGLELHQWDCLQDGSLGLSMFDSNKWNKLIKKTDSARNCTGTPKTGYRKKNVVQTYSIHNILINRMRLIRAFSSSTTIKTSPGVNSYPPQ